MEGYEFGIEEGYMMMQVSWGFFLVGVSGLEGVKSGWAKKELVG